MGIPPNREPAARAWLFVWIGGTALFLGAWLASPGLVALIGLMICGTGAFLTLLIAASFALTKRIEGVEKPKGGGWFRLWLLGKGEAPMGAKAAFLGFIGLVAAYAALSIPPKDPIDWVNRVGLGVFAVVFLGVFIAWTAKALRAPEGP